MNNIKSIRDRLGMSQKALGEALDCTQGNIGHYESDRIQMPARTAQKLIAFAESKGVAIRFEDIYGSIVRLTKDNK